MPNHFLARLILALSLFSISAVSHAAQWYHVEVIVFEQLNTVTDEQWPNMEQVKTGSFTPDSNNSSIHPTSVSTLIVIKI